MELSFLISYDHNFDLKIGQRDERIGRQIDNSIWFLIMEDKVFCRLFAFLFSHTYVGAAEPKVTFPLFIVSY